MPGYLAVDEYPWWSDHPPPARGRVYYAFVEEIAAPSMSDDVDGPDGRTVDSARHTVFAQSPLRFRSSGILINDFHDIVDSFEELDPEQILPDQRERRKLDLQKLLDGIPLPVLDLYIPPTHPDLRVLRGMLVPTSWHVLSASRSPRLGIECPVLIGAPDLAEDFYAFSYLTYAGPVPGPIEVRLRDIFSLAHIPDADFELEEGGGGLPRPPDGPPGDAWIRLRERKLTDLGYGNLSGSGA